MAVDVTDDDRQRFESLLLAFDQRLSEGAPLPAGAEGHAPGLAGP